jgi:hypothetical protein
LRYFEAKRAVGTIKLFAITNQLLCQLSYAGVCLEAPYDMRKRIKNQNPGNKFKKKTNECDSSAERAVVTFLLAYNGSFKQHLKLSVAKKRNSRTTVKRPELPTVSIGVTKTPNLSGSGFIAPPFHAFM